MASRPPTGRDAFGALLSRSYRQWRRAADLRLQPFDLTEATWLPLVYIARASTPPRQKDLAASMFVDNSSVVRLQTTSKARLSSAKARPTGVPRIILLTPAGRSPEGPVARRVAPTRWPALRRTSRPD